MLGAKSAAKLVKYNSGFFSGIKGWFSIALLFTFKKTIFTCSNLFCLNRVIL